MAAFTKQSRTQENQQRRGIFHRAAKRGSSSARPPLRSSRSRGFTLIEALVAITIVTMSGSALLLGMSSSIQSTQRTLDEAIATGMAEQLIDEVLGNRYASIGAGPIQTPLTASTWEASGTGRERFDDTDDFNSFQASPPEDTWGVALGQGDEQGGTRHPSFQLPSSLIDSWRQEIEVYYVDEDDPTVQLTGNNTSQFRAVEVSILKPDDNGTMQTLVTLRRVYCYVPPPQ